MSDSCLKISVIGVIVVVAVGEIAVAGGIVHEGIVKKFVLFLFVAVAWLLGVALLAFGLVLLDFLRLLLVDGQLVDIPALFDGPVLFESQLLGIIIRLLGLARY